jgi:signal transduction histidine kinase
MSAVGTNLRVPLALGTRIRDAGRTAAYLVVSLGLGILDVVVMLPLLALRSGDVWRLADLERKAANRFLRARIPPLPSGRAPDRSVLALLALRLPTALAAILVAAAPVSLTAILVVYGAKGLGGTSQYVGPWTLNPAIGLVLWLLAVPAGIVSVAALEGLATPLREAVSQLLVTPAAAVGGTVREALAESIGDRRLAVAYWLPERSSFVDEHGQPVVLPEPGSGRTWTAVEHEGRRVAAIIHDAELDARPELVRAAAAGSVLALANERLKAELRARVEEVRASRTRIVEASMDARRRLERDLHDGAQQQLVALSLDLQLIKSRVSGDPAAGELVEGAIDKLAIALAELRELARGIHPAILSERGVEAAFSALVERAPLPVTCEVEVDGRLSPAVEAAAYFVAAEALTNVAKYAEATSASVRVRVKNDCLEVEVVDDGVGGADPSTGSGLHGLQDRVSALDGSLSVDSPPGQGTRVLATLPLPRPVDS